METRTPVIIFPRIDAIPLESAVSDFVEHYDNDDMIASAIYISRKDTHLAQFLRMTKFDFLFLFWLYHCEMFIKHILKTLNVRGQN